MSIEMQPPYSARTTPSLGNMFPLVTLSASSEAFSRRDWTKAVSALGTGHELSICASLSRCVCVMPIQGEKHGSQEQQRIYREYDERFEALENVVAKFKGVAIRIDKEHPLEDLVGRIKKEIRAAQFIIADLTDERPSCYFEAGFAEALPRPVIYVASKQSVIKPGSETKVHFDIHMNVHFFTNQKELKDKVSDAIEKNKSHLFRSSTAEEG